MLGKLPCGISSLVESIRASLDLLPDWSFGDKPGFEKTNPESTHADREHPKQKFEVVKLTLEQIKHQNLCHQTRVSLCHLFGGVRDREKCLSTLIPFLFQGEESPH
jgi:hypothetical protein